MKKFRAALIISCLFLAFSGCFQSNTLIKVTPKGDGTIEETFTIKAAVIKQLQDMQQAANDEANKKTELWTRTQFDDKARTMGKGVRVLSFTPIKNADYEGYTVVYKFTDINTLRFNQNASENMPAGANQTDKDKNEYITFHFDKGKPAKLLIIMPEIKKVENVQQDMSNTESVSTETEAQAIEQTKVIFKDMNFVLRLEVQGKILKTDASYMTGSTITLFEMDFNKLLENPEKLKELREKKPKSLEEMKKIMADIPGIKANLNSKINVSYQ